MRLRPQGVHRLHPAGPGLVPLSGDEAKRDELRLPGRRLPAHVRAGNDAARDRSAVLWGDEAGHDRERARDVHVERRKHRDRVAGQADHGCLAAARAHPRRADALRAARLLGDVVEARVCAKRQAHNLEGTRRNAAGCEDQVCLRGLVEGRSQLCRGVPRAQVGDDAPAGLLDEAAQQDAVRIGNLPAFEGLAGALELRARRDDDDARAGQNREGAVADRGSGRQSRPVQDAARLQDRGTCSEGLARHANIRAQLRGDADLYGVGRLSDARRMIRVLDFHDSVGAFGDRRARHDAPRLPLLESILAGVSRRNVARDGQSPRALTLEVLAAHRKSVHCGVRERREGDQRGNVDRQAATQTFLDGERLVGEDVAERQRLDQLAMLRGRQGGIVHVSKCRARWGGARRAGRACSGCCGVAGRAAGSGRLPRVRCTRRGPGWAVAAHFSSPDMVARGNCSIRSATRRRHAVTGLLVLPNPRLVACVSPRWRRGCSR